VGVDLRRLPDAHLAGAFTPAAEVQFDAERLPWLIDSPMAVV